MFTSHLHVVVVVFLPRPMMVITQKITSLAFEIHDGEPSSSLIEYFKYMCAHTLMWLHGCNVLTGQGSGFVQLKRQRVTLSPSMSLQRHRKKPIKTSTWMEYLGEVLLVVTSESLADACE